MRHLIAAIRFGCWCHGHTWAFEFSRHSIRLHCIACDRRTPGWEINLPAPAPVSARIIRFKRRLREAA